MLRAFNIVVLSLRSLRSKMTKAACRSFSTTGTCRYGDKCKFTHKPSTRSLAIETRLFVQQMFQQQRQAYEDMQQKLRGNLEQTRNMHIKNFFKKYPQFSFDEKEGAVSEWRRLCREVLKVDPDDKEKYIVRESKRALCTALIRQFNARFGTDPDSIDSWQAICHVLDIPAPTTLEECREVVLCTHVNLVDLTESYDGAPVKFDTERALSTYCQSTGKIFPREHAEAGGLLKTLLRHIWHPRDERQVRKQAKTRAQASQTM